MISPKSLILNARLKPEAKKPPNGAISELNVDSANECNTNGYTVIVCGSLTTRSSELRLDDNSYSVG